MLIPCSLAMHWHGGADPATGEYRRLDEENPVTDYDRACAAAWPGRSILELMGAQVLALYTEFDWHTWDSRRQIAACGGWLPTDDELRSATWSDAIQWRADHTDYFLMNSAADATKGLLGDEFMPVRLSPGTYTIVYSDITSECVGCFHRFIRNDCAA